MKKEPNWEQFYASQRNAGLDTNKDPEGSLRGLVVIVIVVGFLVVVAWGASLF